MGTSHLDEETWAAQECHTAPLYFHVKPEMRSIEC